MNAPRESVDKRYLDPELAIDERVDCLVDQMTLREKIAQTQNSAPPIPRLGIPAYDWWNECLHGVARAGLATVFPQAIAMAATFDEDLIEETATAISDEARAKYHQALRQGNRGINFGLTYWTPNINIFRDPRWGRGQETYGECPFLTARIGVAFCKGLQGKDPNHLKLVATPKHYAVHSGPESKRHEFDARCSPRDLRETYLPAFKACVQEARAESVMGAYNRTNGEPCCGSRTLLQDILRDEWGFEGYVVSDCGAIDDFHSHHKLTGSGEESAALAVRNGCDLNCGHVYYKSLLGAVEQGLITETDIDTALKRLFRARMKLGMFDPDEGVSYAAIPPSVVHCEHHRELARRVARESIVLLKNNGVLPLSDTLNDVVVIGPNAHDDAPLLANYHGYAPCMATVFDGILARLSPGCRVNLAKGCHLHHDTPIHDGDIRGTIHAGTDAVVAVLGNTNALEGEEGEVALSDGGGDRSRIGLPGRQTELLTALRKRIDDVGDGHTALVLVVLSGSPVDLEDAEPLADAVLYGWYPGEEGGHALADILFGDVNPSARLPVTVVKSLDQLPDFEDYSMRGRTYRFMESTPRYRFGYGLSYTTFAYAKLAVDGAPFRAGDGASDQTVRICAEVTNTGARDGAEVAQLYVTHEDATVPVPRLQLAGFSRLHLRAGETKTVSFDVRAEQLLSWRDDGSAMLEPGTVRVSVGGGQPDDPAAHAVAGRFKLVEER